MRPKPGASIAMLATLPISRWPEFPGLGWNAPIWPTASNRSIHIVSYNGDETYTLGRYEGPTYSLLVSNVGWVERNNTNYNEVLALFEAYRDSGQYDQVSLWSSEADDPIEEYQRPEDAEVFGFDTEEVEETA